MPESVPTEEERAAAAASAAASSAEATAAAAASAAAVANGAAAAAQTDAVEREREFLGRVETWQMQTGSRLEAMETEVKETRAAVSGIASVLSSAMERLSSIPPKSETPAVAVVVPTEKAPSEGEGQKAPETRKPRIRLL